MLRIAPRARDQKYYNNLREKSHQSHLLNFSDWPTIRAVQPWVTTGEMATVSLTCIVCTGINTSPFHVIYPNYVVWHKDFSIDRLFHWAFAIALEPQQKPREKNALY